MIAILPWCWLAFLVLLAGGTLRCVYRAGHGLNDHVMAALSLACFAVYGALGFGALSSSAWPLASLAAVGVGASLLLYGFHIMDRGRDPGRGPAWWLMLASQPAWSFVFWVWLLLWIRAPIALVQGASLLWPGPWLLLPLGLSLWSLAYAARGVFRVRRLRLEVPGLPVACARVVQLSDLHFPLDLPRHLLGRAVDIIRGLEPGLVLLSGDFVTPFSERPDQHAGLAEELARLAVPTVACPGNHDQPCWDVLAQQFERHGILALCDAAAQLRIGGMLVEVVGADFRWRGAAEATAALLERLPRPDDVGVSVMLCHDPRVFDGLPPKRFELAVAGHTHGGPAALDMFGLRWSLLTPLGLRDLGLSRAGGCWFYVHPGSWLVSIPPRIGNAPEITVLDLVPSGD